MTDVQVSNARRISFTALAVVSFWVLAWNAYAIAWGSNSNEAFAAWWDPGIVHLQLKGWLTWENALWANRLEIIAVSFTIVPAVSLSLSLYNSSRCLRDPWILISTLLFAATVAFSFLLAEHDALDSFIAKGTYSRHQISWVCLLIPMLLTTAFVIYGAWRRAVRDAEVDAVGEDEDAQE